MFFILKLIINMELIDTPNPNAKKVLAKNISSSNFHNENTQFSISKQLQNLDLKIIKYFCFEPEVNSFNILSKSYKKFLRIVKLIK